MMNTKMKRLALLSLFGLLLGIGATQPAAAQSEQNSQPSVAEAARRARAQKEKEAPGKPAKVITNDDLTPAPSWANGAVQQATAPATGGQASGDAAAPDAKGQKESTEDEKKAKEAKKAELADLKKQLASAQSDLDLYQRAFALQRDTYYSNPDYVHDTDGKAKLDGLQQQIADKQQSVEELKTKVTALQELLGADAPSDTTTPQ